MGQTAPNTDTLKILILDGDPGRTSALADVVKNCGYVCEMAEDPTSANFWLEVQNFDALLCPDGPAYEAKLEGLKRVVKKYPSLPLLFITDNPLSPGAAQAAQLGAILVRAAGQDYSALFPELAALQTKLANKPKTFNRVTVHPVQLPALQPRPATTNERAGVDMILDVPVTINAVVGHTTVRISELLQLGPGSVVELNRRAGEPVDLYVNDKLVAVGEVVVVNEAYGVLITKVIDPKQRAHALG